MFLVYVTEVAVPLPLLSAHGLTKTFWLKKQKGTGHCAVPLQLDRGHHQASTRCLWTLGCAQVRGCGQGCSDCILARVSPCPLRGYVPKGPSLGAGPALESHAERFSKVQIYAPRPRKERVSFFIFSTETLPPSSSHHRPSSSILLGPGHA